MTELVPRRLRKLEGAPVEARTALERTSPGRFCPGPVQDQEKVRVTVVSAFHPR